MNDERDIRIGIVGLGGAAQLILPYFDQVQGVRLAAAADIRDDARKDFTRQHKRPAYASIEALCDQDIDAVWIETPNHLHASHARTALDAGKHVICAKPLATSPEECERLIEPARQADVRLLVGHSKVLDPPIKAMRRIVRSGRLGKVVQVNALLFNDWLQRPRLTSELDATKGGGLIFRQVPHLVDIANFLVGRPALNVRALAGSWDPHFASEGNVSALIEYKGGAVATIAMNAYGYFDSRDLTWGIGGFGDQQPVEHRYSRGLRRRGPVEKAEKYRNNPNGQAVRQRRQGEKMPIFGLTIVSCERGVMRQSPDGIYLYTEDGEQEIRAEPYLGRAAELIELRDCLIQNRTAFPDGAWGRATVELCEAIRRSSKDGTIVSLCHQVDLEDGVVAQ